ncbi:MAG: N-acetylmuramoyl-L-alanine amidase [Steroidobacteraceae bacterium]
MTRRSTIAWLTGAWLVLALALAANAVAAAEIRGIQLSATPDSTQVVVDLSNRTAHRMFRLGNPERIVLDLRDTAASANLRPPAADGIVSAIRIGSQPRHTLRLVFEVTAPIAARVGWAAGEANRGYRLTLDLRGGAGLGATRVDDAAAPPPALNPVRAEHAPAESGRDIVVAIDAGHGGDDPGAIGRGGTREKDVVLAIARSLAARIDREPGMRAVLTRDGDYFIMLRDRIDRARAAKADLFVSIHADSIRDRAVSGASVYVLSEKGATSEAARWLAERENAADLKGGVKLDDKDSTLASVLVDLSQTESISASMEAAERVLASIDRIGVVRKPRVQQAGFVVLKSRDTPSMLIETAYISNPADERRLRSAPQQGQFAAAIFKGVRAYFAANPPDGTRLAQQRRADASVVLVGSASP